MNDPEIYPNKENGKVIPTVGVVAVQGSSVLLVCHEPGGGHITGTYGLPGGRVEEGETEEEAAKREFQEETGLDVPSNNFSSYEGNYIVADVPRKNGTTVKMGWKIFKLQDFKGEFKASGETTPVWLNLKQVEKLDTQKRLAPNVLNVIRAALKLVPAPHLLH